MAGAVPPFVLVWGLLALGALGLWRAWGFGPDVQVDFGRELYLPWRVCESDALYADVAHWSGPLSVAWHALLFCAFGPSLVVVKLSNALVCAAIAYFVHQIAARLVGRMAAFTATGFFLGAVAFAQLLPLANYDYLTPYAHELTHGFALSLGGLWWFVRCEGDRGRAALGCGALLAGVALTKVEVTVAYAMALAVAFGLPCLVGSREIRADAIRNLARVGLGFGVAAATASFALATWGGADLVVASWREPWRVLLGSNVAALPFYRHVMGTNDLAASALRIVLGGLGLAVLVSMIAGISFGWRRHFRERGTLGLGLLLAAAAVAFPFSPELIRFALAPAGLVVVLLLLMSLQAWIVRRDSRSLGRAAVLAFAFALALKMAFDARLAHYGFVLWLPAVLVCIAWLCEGLGAWLESRGGSGRAATMVALAVVLALGLGLNAMTNAHRAVRSASVGEGADAMRVDARADAINQALAHLAQTPPETTVAVLPEGIMLNYLARRAAPTRFINFMPPELEMYGQQAIVEAFRASPPDVVIYLHKRAGLYGTPLFGRDYGRALHGFVRANYDAVADWGGAPFAPDTRFGVRVLERRAP